MSIMSCYTGFFNVRRGWQSRNTKPRFYLRLIRRTGWLCIFTSRTTDGRPFKPKKLSVPFLYPGVPAGLEHFEKKICLLPFSFLQESWLIQKYPGMFDPYSGITNHLSESMNAVLKREQDRKELSVDLLTLGLCYLQIFENYEILKGRSGIGN